MADSSESRVLPGRDLRSNGLPENPPEQGRSVLVTGGAGYIGSVLVPKLIDRGYRVRVLDRLDWGEEPLASVEGRYELVEGDIRELPEGVLDGIDAVIHLAGLSNDPTAEYDPEANWQINAVGTESLARACVERGIERLVFASSCSLYDGLQPGMHDETAPVGPRGAYSESKLHGEKVLRDLIGAGLCPVILRNGTVFGRSPRMRYDLVVNTFVKDALVNGKLSLHGGGWMWRPLVDVQDCADAMIRVLEAPAEDVKGEVFNVMHANYQIRELAFLVTGSMQLLGKTVTLEETPMPEFRRDYECSNAKLSVRLGFAPARSVVQSVAEMLAELRDVDRDSLSDPRYYNIRWLEQLSEAHLSGSR